MTARHPDPHIDRVITLFEQLAPGDLARWDHYYTEGARFKDPFNEVAGVEPIRRIFAHMFDSLGEPRFSVREAIGSGPDCVLTWDFDFTLRGRPMRIHGASHLRFAPDGRIDLHRDYWDAAEELYEKLPLLGGLMRWLKRRLGSGS